MSPTATVHHCSRCELRFVGPVELLDHVRRDHPEPEEAEPIPNGRVVLAVDPSRPDPGAALDVARTLAGQLTASLEIVAAKAPGLGDATTQAYLQERTAACRSAGASWVSWHDLGAGPAASAIVADAADTPATWICMASRARTAVGEKILGSVTSDVLRTADVPVVVVGPEAVSSGHPFTRVVAGVDRSRSAPQVVAAAADLADRLDVRLVLVEVSIPTVDGDPLVDDGYLRAVSEHIERDVNTVVLPGHRAGPPILDFVDDDPTTIIVTGRRPSTAASRFVAGSVAVHLARKAHGPIMIVPGAGTP